MRPNDEVRLKAALNGETRPRGDVITWKELKPAIGYALSEIRYQLRQEQAAAVADLISRIDALEVRLRDNNNAG